MGREQAGEDAVTEDHDKKYCTFCKEKVLFPCDKEKYISGHCVDMHRGKPGLTHPSLREKTKEEKEREEIRERMRALQRVFGRSRWFDSSKSDDD